MPTRFSDYIFYADESGDHSLRSIDQTYPAFALSLCAFRIATYCRRIIPDVLRLKFTYFGHDAVVLHERDIRKQIGNFTALTDQSLRDKFMRDLGYLLEDADFRIFAAVIDKTALRLDMFPTNPYSLSLRICLQSAYLFLRQRRQVDRTSHFIFEKRGAKEDAELELEFRRIADGDNDLRIPFAGFRIHFSDKRTNSTGMQIADLTARPIGLKVIRPNQPNRAFDTIASKIFSGKKFGRPDRGIFVL
jgi:hypothetical protein